MTGSFQYRRSDKGNAAVLLVDHQSGLCNLVGDFSPDDFKNNVLTLADFDLQLQRPTIVRRPHVESLCLLFFALSKDCSWLAGEGDRHLPCCSTVRASSASGSSPFASPPGMKEGH